MLRFIRKRLIWKLLLSYVVVIFAGLIALAVTAELTAPTAFERHIANMDGDMQSMMQGMIQGRWGSENPGRAVELFQNYQASITEAFTLSGLSAFVAALIVSIIMSRWFGRQVSAVQSASHRIAEGHYHERVDVPQSYPIKDGDELVQLSHSFNQMAEKLEQTETMRRQLLGDVTHELRTPLTTIKGSMEGLIDGVLPAEPEIFVQIYKEAGRLQRLVEDLQELSRIEAGVYSLQMKRISINNLIMEAAQQINPQFNNKGVVLNLNLLQDLPVIDGDPDRINQILINLLGNALQYTPEGGSVTVRTRRIANSVAVYIEDTGIGIPAEHLGMVFTRFYRVDKSRSRLQGGSGIGLTITRHLVETHGGEIWAESEGSGKGSRFIFTLPLSQDRIGDR